MILPNNGKVIIIDDQPEDVKELIAALSKEKVPFVHYKEEDLSDLPKTPIENVRLIFLDLELVTDTYVDSKNITAPIKTRLMRVLRPNTPYALVIWSKKENDYKEALIKDFETEFEAYKPIFYTSLPKADIIGKEGAMSKIKKELEIEIAKFKSFNAFLVWEAIVNESSGKLTNDIATLYPPDAEWDKKTKSLLYKLALAYSGKAVDSFDDIKQLKNALYTMTLTFTDNIENSIDKIIDDKFSGYVKKDSREIENFTPVINRLLLVSESSDDPSQPGNLFFSISELEMKLQKNDESFETGKKRISGFQKERYEGAFHGIEKSYSSEKQKIQEIIVRWKSNFNDITVSGLNEDVHVNKMLQKEILENMIGIELNITPLCDYAQEKVKLFRILPGVIIKSEYRKHLNTKPAYVYISDADFRINDIDYLFLFDFRFLHSLTKNEIKNRVVKFRLKHQLLSDIQVKLGAHVNRSGVLYVS